MGSMFSRIECGGRDRRDSYGKDDDDFIGAASSNSRRARSRRSNNKCERCDTLKEQLASLHEDLMKKAEEASRSKTRALEALRRETPKNIGDLREKYETRISALATENVALKNSKDNLSSQVSMLKSELMKSVEKRNELSSSVEKLTCELAEIESFCKTERGEKMQQMENDLAQAKLELALAQEEKDELEWEIQNMMYQMGRSPKPPARPKSSVRKSSGKKKTSRREVLKTVNLNVASFRTPVRENLTPA